jgi:outer membrane receptor protein involved in Fe transport
MQIRTPIDSPVLRPGPLLAAQATLLLIAMAPLAGHAQQSASNATTPASASAPAQETETSEGQLAAVIVTATRREEDIKDIPTSVSAIDASTLAGHYVLNFDDLTRTVPGIAFEAGAGPGLDNIAIRGVSSSSGSATVGIYVDDVSVTVRNTFDGAIQPKMFDLERVEVLRGPQGTLFGASSMGGTVRFITNKPDLNDFYVEGSTDVSYTQHGGVNNETYAVLNLPISPGTFAVRLGGDITYQSGWIDHYAPTATGFGVGTDGNPITLYQNDSTGVEDNKNVNAVQTEVGRISAKYVTDGDLTISPQVLFQHTHAGDSALYFLTLGQYDEDKHVAEPEDDQLFSPSLTITKSFGPVELTSVSAYFRRDFFRTLDGTLYNSNIFADVLLPSALEGPQPPGAPLQPVPTTTQLTNAADIIGFTPSPVVYTTITNQISQEFRLTSKEPANIGIPMHWQVGLYFSDQRQSHIDDEHIPGLQADFQQIFGYSIYNSYIGSAAIPGVTYANDLIYNANSHYFEQQIAPFGEFEFQLTPNLKATAGVRYVTAQTSFNFIALGFFTIGLPTPYNKSVNYNATTPKFALDYALTPEVNVYTTVANGFRLGGPTGPDPANVPGGTCDQDYANLGLPGAPLQYNSDSLWSYELGTKGRYLDNRLSVNAAVYAINWQDIQQSIILPICGFAFTTNAGNANIFGSELEVQSRVTSAWTLGLNAGNTHGYITKSFVPDIVGVGENILNVPFYNVTASSDYEIPIGADRALFVRADFPYVGRSHSNYAAIPVPYHFNPSYGTLNASIGLLQKSFHGGTRTLSMALYAKNLLASHEIIQYPAVFQVQEGYTARPQTIGVTISLLQ